MFNDRTFQGFDIVDIFENNVEACCRFDYCGHEVSMSNIGRKDGACLNQIHLYKNDELIEQFDTVQDAINYVNALR